jgi:hypothetical protein
LVLLLLLLGVLLLAVVIDVVAEQLQGIGRPLVGDLTYGAKTSSLYQACCLLILLLLLYQQ